MKSKKIENEKYIGLFGLAVILIMVVFLISTITDINPTGFVTYTNFIERQSEPSHVTGCDPSDPVNIYEKTISHGDGTVTVLTYNACYPGCTGISVYTRFRELLSEGTECIGD